MSQIKTLRKKWGDYCHICGYKIDFAAPPNSYLGPTRDHIIPKEVILKGLSDGKGQEIRLAHAYCNSMRGMGRKGWENHPKFLKFLELLQTKNLPRDPKYSGPINHGIDLPPQSNSYCFYFVILGIQFDFRWARGYHWHFRVGSKTSDMLILAGKKGR